MDENLREAVKARYLREHGENPSKRKWTPFAVPAVAIILLLALAKLLSPITITSQSGTILSRINNSQITIVHGGQNVPDLRQWKDLTQEERDIIIAEARRLFPEIEDIGTRRISWAPISQWLAEEKQVVHSNPRDLFR